MPKKGFLYKIVLAFKNPLKLSQKKKFLKICLKHTANFTS